MNPVVAYQFLVLHGFGPSVVRKQVVQDKELVYEVKADTGAVLTLSAGYVAKLMSEAEPRGRVVTRGPFC